MKKKLCLLFIFSLFSTIFAARDVVEVGANVRMNTLSKIENARQTLENIKQTQNQIQSLKNEAMHLNSWAATVLKDTVGITTKDIDNLLAIKKLS